MGGTILHTLSWQWLFAINVLPGTLALLLAVRALPRDAIRMQAPFDTVGAILSALLLGSTIMAANSLQNATSQFGSLCWMALAALSGMAFIWQIRRTGSPLLPPSMFKMNVLPSRPSRRWLLSSAGITFIALPFLFQSEYGYSPVVSALLFTPWPLGIVLIAPHAGRWADTISAPAISTLGLVIFVVGLILLATLPARPSMWDICLRSPVCGIGFGCFQSPNNREMLSNVIREHASYASGVLSIMRTFGQCLGAAAVAVLLAADERSIHVALWSAAAASAVSVVVSASRLRKITHPAETG
nr:Spectinomycin tetracycline efflux pump [Klebsiella pneumoniae]